MKNFDESRNQAYVPNPELPKAFWLDVDGSIAERVHPGVEDPRGPYDGTRVGEDAVIEHIHDIVLALVAAGYKCVVMTGRGEECRKETQAWFDWNSIPYDDIFMRPWGDKGTKDCHVKYDLFWDKVVPKYDVRFALDDRQQVVDYTREVLKIPVLQVATGDF